VCVGRGGGSGGRQGAWLVEAGGGRPSVAARAKAGHEGGPVGVGRGWAVAVGRPKGITTFCFIQTHFQPN
jgi:hypothetical protein